MIFFGIVIGLIIGIVVGFKIGKKYINKNVVLDAIIDATSKEVIEKEKQTEADKDFSIEFYPLTKRYYPKYKEKYLKKDSSTGIIEKMEPYLFAFSSYFDSEKAARDYIEIAKEHLLKRNVVSIKL